MRGAGRPWASDPKFGQARLPSPEHMLGRGWLCSLPEASPQDDPTWPWSPLCPLWLSVVRAETGRSCAGSAGGGAGSRPWGDGQFGASVPRWGPSQLLGPPFPSLTLAVPCASTKDTSGSPWHVLDSRDLSPPPLPAGTLRGCWRASALLGSGPGLLGTPAHPMPTSTGRQEPPLRGSSPTQALLP